ESRWATPENHQSIIKSLEPPAIALVLGAERLGLGVLADLGRGDIPPGAAAREEAVFLDLGDDDAGARLIAGLAQGLAELLGGLDVPGPGPEALGVPGQVDRDVFTLQPVGRRVAVAELVAEADAGPPHLEPPDALVAVVLGEHNGDLEPFLHGGHQLGRVHQVGPVADEDKDLALGLGQPDTQAGRDLVAHARIAELEVAGAAAGGIPQLEQVSGRAARGGDDRVARPGLLVERPDQLALAHRLALMVSLHLAPDRLAPGAPGGGDLVAVARPGAQAGRA